MEAKRRHIKDGGMYSDLFPVANGSTGTVKRFASVDDTVNYIPKMVGSTLDHTKAIAQELKGNNIYDTCKNIWHFVYDHINYKKDEEGYEQIRTPARTWHDRKVGVDCDCYTVFISSILVNLGIKPILRITKYNYRSYFQHIYPIVPYNNSYITIDCVTNQFNHEVPYSEKKDYPMELQYLDGLDEPALYQNANDLYLMGLDGDEYELGKILKKNALKKPGFLSKIKENLARKKAADAAAVAAGAPPKKKKKGFLKKLSLRKVLNVVNKINPATVLLRNGLLAAMKLNVKNVAQRLRWSYLTAEQAAAKNIDAAKYQKLLSTRIKLEKIFEGAGGKPSNLRKAILNGKGNKNKAVQGLGMVGYFEEYPLHAYMPLEQLLGPDIYYSENIEGMEEFQGFGELGEPVTLATVGAAMGVISGIVAALKQIGDIFKNKQPGSEDFDEANTDAPENNVPVTSSSNSTSAASSIIASNSAIAEDNEIPSSTISPVARKSSYQSSAAQEEEYENPQAASEETATQDGEQSLATGTNNPTQKEDFWKKNKKWLKPVMIGVGGLTLVAIGVSVLKKSKAAHHAAAPKALSGFPRKKKKNKKHKHKHAIALI